jgi:hypothetical protein
MELNELQEQILNMQELEKMQSKPAAAYDPSEGMSEDELRSFVRFLFGKLTAMTTTLEQLLASQKASEEERRRLMSQIESLQKQLQTITEKFSEVCRQNLQIIRQRDKFTEELTILKADHFGSSKSRKMKAKPEVAGRNDARPDFDGTEESLKANGSVQAEQEQKDEPKYPSNDEDASSSTPVSDDAPRGAESQTTSSRKGMKYNKPEAANLKDHMFDMDSLPEGCKILRRLSPYKVRNLVSYIEEHRYARYKVLFPDGEVRVVVNSSDEEGKRILDEVVPGTHITATLLSHMIFNRYQMCCPDYRESKNRWADMQWNTCRQNLANWADKGAILLNKLVPALKEAALEEGANVNVDETWCRYQTHFGHKKTYMWCLVNRKSKIVIFFYEDCEDEDGAKHEGGRRRAVLKEFLADANIKSLQSDGYIAYVYLDDEMVDIEHLCCLAHADNKFKDALKCGCTLAAFFIRLIGKLYTKERLYRMKNYTPERIRQERNSAETEKIVQAIRIRMLELLSRPAGEISEKMHGALTYLQKFWKQLFAYRNDGEYTIDNMAAERAIRPMTVQRKNSLFFGSTNGAHRSAIYNTFIETCKAMKINFRDYLVKVITEMKKGRTDYENLLPMTISLK